MEYKGYFNWLEGIELFDSRLNSGSNFKCYPNEKILE